MTLEEVAMVMRKFPFRTDEGTAQAVGRARNYIISKFEADPDFGLRGRVEKVLRFFEYDRDKELDGPREVVDPILRKFREALDPKEGRT